MKMRECLSNHRGAVAWVWLLLVCVVVVAASVVVFYMISPPEKAGARAAVVRGKVPPIPAAVQPLSEEMLEPESAMAALSGDDDPVDGDANAALPTGEATGDETAPASSHQSDSVAGAGDAAQAAAENTATPENEHPDPLAQDGTPSTESPAERSDAPVVPQKDKAVSAEVASAGRTDADVQTISAPWSVQVGAFGNRNNADTLAADLARRGYPSHIFEQTANNGRPLYMVRFGYFEQRGEATQSAVAFKKKEGMPVVVVRTVPAGD